MSNILRFGIPSLDKLFGGTETEEKDKPKREGVLLPDSVGSEPSDSSISLCISGPDGTGKSVLGLHLASRYLADCRGDQKECGQKLPKVLYISTDLKFEMARKVWSNFVLNWPNKRIIPFGLTYAEQEEKLAEGLEIGLLSCKPLGGDKSDTVEKRETEPLAHYLTHEHAPGIYFVDLASYTAGDDWGFVNRVLSALETPRAGEPRHLVVLDSVEGFEVLVGERDAFGEAQPRRSRIAQIMRSVGNKCHALFIVEEPEEGKHLPEEFVTDVVIRLRSALIKDYVRRTVEIEKVRGHSHVRGQHPYLIRPGSGSTTGLQENSDDPILLTVVPNEQQGQIYQSYLHVCHSLHYLNRGVMQTLGKGRPVETPERYAAFGIRYLDNMLGSSEKRSKRANGDDRRGLRCGTTTALIGNSETQKSPLGYAFLARSFRDYAERFLDQIKEVAGYNKQQLDDTLKEAWQAVAEWIDKREATGSVNDADPERYRTKDWRDIPAPRNNKERRARIFLRLYRCRTIKDTGGDYVEDGVKQEVDDRVLAACWLLKNPLYRDEQKNEDVGDGIPVLLTTQDIHVQELARHFLPWLTRQMPDLEEYEKNHKQQSYLTAFRLCMEEFTICRRLEIHDLPAAVLIHILQNAVTTAQQMLHEGNLAEDTEGRFAQSWGIRVVIDDFSIMKNTYVEIHDEPLLLRFLVFYLGREGVTTLLIDTQPGQPDTAVASPLDSELRSLVNNHLYTWRFSFYGENRVAIAAIPPVSPKRPTVVRELRESKDKLLNVKNPEVDISPLIVDPHFELYSGIEKGEPRPVPLEIRLFAETESFKRYIEEENVYFRELFTPVPQGRLGEPGDLIFGVPASDYDRLRDFCYLQRDTRLDHTILFQVDEFWYLRRQGVRRAGTFRPQAEYLNGVTAYTVGQEEKEEKRDKWVRDWATDPFGLFQMTERDKEIEEERKKKTRAGTTKQNGEEEPPSNESIASNEMSNESEQKHHCRWEQFATLGYFVNQAEANKAKKEEENNDCKLKLMKQEEEIREESIDRVPFMWDFGFLLCKQQQWERCGEAKLEIWNESYKEEIEAASVKAKCVEDIWEGLPRALKERKKQGAVKDQPEQDEQDTRKIPRPSWRLFMEACYQVGRAEAYRLGQNFPAFDLHVVAAQTLSCLILEIWASEIYERLLRKDQQERERFTQQIARRYWKHEEEKKPEGLLEWLNNEDYQVDLFKTWLLLIEVLDLDGMAQAIRDGNWDARPANPHAVTVRHWYKTACKATEHMQPADPVVAVGLPGHFSMRGDWFLAVAGTSRSSRLADRALDLLNSRRANHVRLKEGLGLPVRKIHERKELRTGLTTIDHGHAFVGLPDDLHYRVSKVTYENLLKLGATSDPGRQSIPNAPREEEAFFWFWRSGLDRYYRHTKIWQDWLNSTVLWWDRLRYLNRNKWVNGFERYDRFVKDEVNEKKDCKAWSRFNESCDELLQELKEATRLARESREGN